MLPPIKQLEVFAKFAAKELGLTRLPKIHFVGDKENSKNAFGHSKGNEIWVRVTSRHPVDIMRTIAHELIHVKQTAMGKSGEQYREDEANAIAGRVMRKFGTTYPQIFKQHSTPPNLKEDGVVSAVPANAMGASSSTHGTGAIDMIDPLMATVKRKKLRDIVGHKSISMRDQLKKERGE